jgi:hypothetical protein
MFERLILNFISHINGYAIHKTKYYSVIKNYTEHNMNHTLFEFINKI